MRDHQLAILYRVSPFVVFVLLTVAQTWFGDLARYWVYALKTIIGVLLLLWVWPHVAEMRWRITWQSLGVGVLMAVIWIATGEGITTQAGLWDAAGLDDDAAAAVAAWDPFASYGAGAALAWFFVIVRILGSTLVVPPLEEAFYRSFVYRYLTNPRITTVSLGVWHWRPFIWTALLFGIAHNEWLAGIICGASYQALTVRSGDLGEAMSAHGTTNLLLGGWILATDAWHFW